jgi:hypothetical protein
MSLSSRVAGLVALTLVASVKATNVYKIPIQKRAATSSGTNVQATDWFYRGDNEVCSRHGMLLKHDKRFNIWLTQTIVVQYRTSRHPATKPDRRMGYWFGGFAATRHELHNLQQPYAL